MIPAPIPTTMEHRPAEVGRREENVSQLETRVDTAGQSAAADVADDRRTFVNAVTSQLHSWDVYLERLQIKAATMGGSDREQAEGAISELRRRRIALAERLGEVNSASGETWREGRKHVQAARDELERSAAEAEARLERGGKS